MSRVGINRGRTSSGRGAGRVAGLGASEATNSPVLAASRADPAPVSVVGEEDSYCDVPGMDPGFGNLFDQDTALMHWQREGMYASGKGAQTYSVYLESRLRHIHGTIDKYLNS